MNSRDRVNAAIERRPHDRVPRHETFWEDTIRRWIGEGLAGGAKEALEHLRSDMAGVSPFLWPSPCRKGEETISEDSQTRIFKDSWGATLRLFKDHQTTPEHLGWECDSPEAWHASFRERILSTDPSIDIGALLESDRAAKARGQWRFFTVVEPFESMRKLVGDVESMMAIKEEPEWIADMAEVTTTRSLRSLEGLYRSEICPDGLWIYGDMAFNHATFCSPGDYRDLIWPQHKRLCDWAHGHGMKTIYHSDGNINAVIGQFIEAGIDVLQPLECKAGMDIRKLIPEYGEQVSFFGNIDVMVLIRGDIDEIEQEIKKKLSAGMATRGYICHSDHSIPPQVSWELYQKIVTLIDKHGVYT